MKTIGVHSGSHHADDCMGVAILHTLYPNAGIIRSRDPAVLTSCDALVDVGGEYDVARNRFDHHQKGFSTCRANGIPYAGAGLVWKSYGAQYVQAVIPEAITAESAEFIAQAVDAKLIEHVDAVDSGIMVPGPVQFGFSAIISTFNTRWSDAAGNDDVQFQVAVHVTKMVLRNLVLDVAAEHSAAEIVRSANVLANGRILVLDVPRLPYDAVVVREMPDVLFVVYPESTGKQHQVRVVPKVLGAYEARADLPAAWAGLRGEELAAATGVTDAVFAHNGRFICGANSKEGAIRMAELAVAAL